MDEIDSILVIVYRLLERGEDYCDLGANDFDQRQPQAVPRKLVGRLEPLSFKVLLQPRRTAEVA